MGRAGFKPVEWLNGIAGVADNYSRDQARHVAAVDKWPLIEGDVRDIDFSRHEGRVELVTVARLASLFPWGKHRGRNDERDMWPEAVRAVRETKPKAFILRMSGLTRSSFATYLAYIVHQLELSRADPGRRRAVDDHLSRLERRHTATRAGRGDLSYRVVYRVLNAANYGIPERRKRANFVGFRSDLGVEWSFPEATHSLDALAWDQLRNR